MDDWNSVESQLRSWRLRQPSPQIEQTLFGGSEAQSQQARRTARHWQGGWVAGLATCAILLFTAVNMVHLNGIAPRAGLIASAAISNASYAASFVEVQHNCVSAPIFGWTNDGELHSSIRSFDLLNTNLLR